MKKFLLAANIVFFASILIVYSQVESSPSAQYLYAMHPLQMIARGMKIEVERREPNSMLSFSLLPEFYYGDIENADNNIMIDANRDTISVLGWGAEANARFYVKPSFIWIENGEPATNIYLICGLGYKNIALDYSAKAWTIQTENGRDIYRLTNTSVHNTINRINAQIGLGILVFWGRNIFSDIFLYNRVSSANQHSDAMENVAYKDSYFLNAGNSFAFGFRLGIRFD